MSGDQEKDRKRATTNRDTNANDTEEGRPKRRRTAVTRFVDEFRDEIESVLAQSNDGVEGEDLGADEQADLEDFLEEEIQEVSLFSLKKGISFEEAAQQIFGREESEPYDSSFIDDESEYSEDNKGDESDEEDDEGDESDTEFETETETESETAAYVEDILDGDSDAEKENIVNKIKKK